MLQGICVVNVIEFTPLSVGDYVMPPWAQVLGWLMALVPVFTIIVFAIYGILTSHTNPEYEGLTFWKVRMVGACRKTYLCSFKYILTGGGG